MTDDVREDLPSRANQQVVAVDLDQIATIAHTGVNRAYVFMGIGTNVARDPQWDKYQLPELEFIQIVPPRVSVDKLSEFKTEFGKWVTTNGLRELLETFAVYLENVYRFVLMVDTWANATNIGAELPPVDLDKQEKVFMYKGLPDKIQVLQTGYCITCDFVDDIKSLHQARNCLVHGAGIVRDKDANNATGMTVSWRVLELYGYEADGTEVTARSADLPKAFPENSAVHYRFARTEKTTRIGEEFILEPIELAEICSTVNIAINEFQLAVAKYAQRRGAVINYLNKDGSNGPLPDHGYSITATPIDRPEA